VAMRTGTDLRPERIPACPFLAITVPGVVKAVAARFTAAGREGIHRLRAAFRLAGTDSSRHQFAGQGYLGRSEQSPYENRPSRPWHGVVPSLNSVDRTGKRPAKRLCRPRPRSFATGTSAPDQKGGSPRDARVNPRWPYCMARRVQRRRFSRAAGRSSEAVGDPGTPWLLGRSHGVNSAGNHLGDSRFRRYKGRIMSCSGGRMPGNLSVAERARTARVDLCANRRASMGNGDAERNDGYQYSVRASPSYRSLPAKRQHQVGRPGEGPFPADQSVHGSHSRKPRSPMESRTDAGLLSPGHLSPTLSPGLWLTVLR
jgi:hypothetical protein